MTLIVQMFRWDREPILKVDRKALEGATVVTDTGKELKLEPAPNPPESGSPRIYVRVPAGTRYIDVDIPNTMASGKGELFKWRVLAEKWQPRKKK